MLSWGAGPGRSSSFCVWCLWSFPAPTVVKQTPKSGDSMEEMQDSNVIPETNKDTEFLGEKKRYITVEESFWFYPTVYPLQNLPGKG